MKRERQWTCKIGYADTSELSATADKPLRTAVKEAYLGEVGKEPDFCESGWGEPTPDLGLATTRVLLDEIKARLKPGVPELHLLAAITQYLSENDLNYRTVDMDEPHDVTKAERFAEAYEQERRARRIVDDPKA